MWLFCYLIWWLVDQREKLHRFDQPVGRHFGGEQAPHDELEPIREFLREGLDSIHRKPKRERLQSMRDFIDNFSEGIEIDASITATSADGVPAEWVIAEGADPSRRMLYLHGGAFMIGSPRSHRVITEQFSRIIGGAVLAIDYRLMPENPRMAGVEDCRTAYRWILNNGPEGPSPANFVAVAGDSAGGNLSLSLSSWVRDQPLRKPDAVVAFSPATDSTLSSPALIQNVDTDPLLGPQFGYLGKVPKWLLFMTSWAASRLRPDNPAISPIHDHLRDLPPTLLQASECEMLYDDSRRYVNKAKAAGSPVELHTWKHMVHVWQIFHPQLTHAREAWDEIRHFFNELEGERSNAA
ncbi:alpha/beta hydrolase [Pseudomaricurvus alkylphenolicus]|nr:alpha/beta hydrolase [Pseudomaricurvus alkylphenolicus]